jgi:Mg-chelatase subunit ChlI
MEYEPSSDALKGDKIVPRDFVNKNDAKRHAMKKQHCRLERVAAVAPNSEKEEACCTVIHVAAYESKQAELAVCRVKQEIGNLDDSK